MIISKTILMKWNSKNKAYYLSKGYEFTRIGNCFELKIEDLNPNSKQKIEVACDNCGEHKMIVYRDYMKRKNNEYYCNACANRLYGGETRRKQKLTTSGSLLQHMSAIMGRDEFIRHYSEKNEVPPNQVGWGSNKVLWFRCTNDNRHPDYCIAAHRFSKGTRCPICGHRQRHFTTSLEYAMIEEIGDDYMSKWSLKNVLQPSDYTRQSGEKVWFCCENNEHEDYYRLVNSEVRFHFRCPSCVAERKTSIIQEKTAKYIMDNYKYTLLHEQSCNLHPRNPKTGYPLRYDNEIPELKLIIEVMGEQHYYAAPWIDQFGKHNEMTPQQQLTYLQEKDKYKKEYALAKGYSYLEIRYSKFLNDSYKTLIDDAIRAAEQKLQKGA